MVQMWYNEGNKTKEEQRMKVNVSSGLLNACAYLAEIEIDGKYVTLYQFSKRRYFLHIESDGFYEFSSRKAVDKFLVTI